MNYHTRKAVGALILGLALAAGVLFTEASAAHPQCRDTFIKRVASPDGKLAVYLYYRDCTSANYTWAQVRTQPTATFADGDEVCHLVTLRGRLKTIEAVWKDDKHIHISSPDRLAWDLGISSQHESCNDIKVSYDLNVEPAPPEVSDDPRVEAAIRKAIELSGPCLTEREGPGSLDLYYCRLDGCEHSSAVSLLLMHLYDSRCPVSKEAYALLKFAGRALEVEREELEQVRPQVTTARRAALTIARTRREAEAARARIRRRPPGGETPQRLFSVDLDYKEGFIDSAAQLVIEPQFVETTEDFSDGMAKIAAPSGLGQNTKYGYIDATGRLAIPPRFERASDFHDGLAWVEESMWLDGPRGFIDKTGRIVIPFREQSDVPRFSEGLAAVGFGAEAQTPGGYGFIDKTGRTVIDPRFTYAGDFSEGLAWVHVGDNRANLINGVNFLDEKGGFIDKTGKFVIGPGDYGLSDDSNFSEGLAAVRIGGKWAYIDRTGRVRIRPRSGGLHPFSDGMARIDIKGKAGYIDRTGRLRIPPRYDIATDFSEGLAVVEVRGRGYGYIDKAGRLVIGPGFDHADRFIDGMARVYTRERGVGYVDKKGSYVWGPFH